MTRFPIGRPRFVSTEDAIAFHELLISRFGGSLGMRDASLLDSALAMPRQSFGGEYAHAYPFQIAAAYAFHIAKNHPFVDGNKRVALMCAGSFLRMNGWDLLSQGESAADAILAMLEGRMDKNGFAVWLEANCKPRSAYELRDFMGQLSDDRIHEFLRSYAANQKAEEINATAAEVEQAIPLAGQLLRSAAQFQDAGDERAFSAFLSQGILLIAMYRLAEDQGYEW